MHNSASSKLGTTDAEPPTYQTPVIVTVLEPHVRDEIDLATRGIFSAVHTSSIADAMEAVRHPYVRALLLSPHAVDRYEIPSVNRLLHGTPGVTTVAVVAERATIASEQLLALGACGVRHVVDLSNKQGWTDLRTAVDEDGREVAFRIATALAPALTDASNGAKEFFAMLVRHASDLSSARSLANILRVHPNTLTSRFHRLRLPSVKRYIEEMRALYATAYLEVPSVSIAAVARRLNYSSPQSFGRHIYATYSLTAGAFRRNYPFAAMVTRYVDEFIAPYRFLFTTFNPLR